MTDSQAVEDRVRVALARIAVAQSDPMAGPAVVTAIRDRMRAPAPTGHRSSGGRTARRTLALAAGVLLIVATVVLLHRGDRQEPVQTGPRPGGLPAPSDLRDLPPPPLSARVDPIEVWTGRELVVWGGYRNEHVTGSRLTTPIGYADGARYNPTIGRWELMARSPLPHSTAPLRAAWSGRFVVVVQGDRSATYDPGANSWSAIQAVDLGSVDGEVGFGSGVVAVGVAVGPTSLPVSRVAVWSDASASWRSVPLPSTPGLRATVTSDMAWDGHDVVFPHIGSPGTALDPTTGAWSSLAPAPQPPGTALSTWNGREVVTVAGQVHGAFGRELVVAGLDPTNGRWHTIGTVPVEATEQFAPVTAVGGLVVISTLEGAVVLGQSGHFVVLPRLPSAVDAEPWTDGENQLVPLPGTDPSVGADGRLFDLALADPHSPSAHLVFSELDLPVTAAGALEAPSVAAVGQALVSLDPSDEVTTRRFEAPAHEIELILFLNPTTCQITATNDGAHGFESEEARHRAHQPIDGLEPAQFITVHPQAGPPFAAIYGPILPGNGGPAGMELRAGHDTLGLTCPTNAQVEALARRVIVPSP